MESVEMIETIRERLSAAVPADTHIILFGSRARGDHTGGSDYDLLVIEPAVTSTASESVRLRRLLREVPASIDIVVLERALADRRAKVKGTLVERALREGRLLART